MTFSSEWPVSVERGPSSFHLRCHKCDGECEGRNSRLACSIALAYHEVAKIGRQVPPRRCSGEPWSLRKMPLQRICPAITRSGQQDLGQGGRACDAQVLAHLRGSTCFSVSSRARSRFREDSAASQWRPRELPGFVAYR